ncbi:Mediator of RNA polymerase II transcription subunit 21 [Zostera marina]|uniref:Mediator of RNA polymerase II transcription subunit 21 n=1 Tax=Zostera marina TaxID=29655 RepID=A0A0K9PZ06_ZOSMR|nr:Mediator of RNA polymerase II transcription subunit 21 [Zostera marina]
MDIITQLQDQVNTIASIAFNTFGTLQRDAPPMRLSSNYPEPAPSSTNPTEQPPDLTEQTMNMSTALVQSAKTFDFLVAALPLSDEKAQFEKIAQLEAENEALGEELQRQLEAAEEERNFLQELFELAADNCLNMKKSC